MKGEPMEKLLFRKNKDVSNGLVNNVRLQYIDFRVFQIKSGEEVCLNTDANEAALVVEAGKAQISFNGRRCEMSRENPLEQTPELLLLPPRTAFCILAATDLEIVLAATYERDGCCREPVKVSRGQVRETLRGEEETMRTVRTLIPDQEMTNLLLFEVITKAGNWSSYPPHKHDTQLPPQESLLEEIYYYRIEPSSGFAFQGVFTDDFSLDEAYAVRDRDIVAIPKGYHPTSAAPGFTCYTFCVMAGPTREWNFQVHKDFRHLMNWTK